MKIIIVFLIAIGVCFTALAHDGLPETSYSVQKIQYDLDGTEEYFGFALPNSATSASVWKIFRITTTGDDFVLEWADGNQNYDNEWDERAGTVSYN